MGDERDANEEDAGSSFSLLHPLIKIANMITADLATIIEQLEVEFAKPPVRLGICRSPATLGSSFIFLSFSLLPSLSLSFSLCRFASRSSPHERSRFQTGRWVLPVACVDAYVCFNAIHQSQQITSPTFFDFHVKFSFSRFSHSPSFHLWTTCHARRELFVPNGNILSVSSIFKCNRGKTNDKFITS